jgi:aspartyl/asparaginyl-tRNA synthetase
VGVVDYVLDMEIAEAFVKFVVKRALEKCPQEMEFFEKNEKAFAVEGLTDEEKKEIDKKGPSKGFNDLPPSLSLSLFFQFLVDNKVMRVVLNVEWRKVPLRTRLQSIISQPFARMTYTEAIDLLEKSGVKFEIPVLINNNIHHHFIETFLIHDMN